VTRVRDRRPGIDFRYGWVFLLSITAGAHTASYHLMGTKSIFFPGVKRPDCEADHLPPCSAEVMNAWGYTSTVPYFFFFLGVVFTEAQGQLYLRTVKIVVSNPVCVHVSLLCVIFRFILPSNSVVPVYFFSEYLMEFQSLFQHRPTSRFLYTVSLLFFIRFT
jgi:hypothetical protein